MQVSWFETPGRFYVQLKSTQDDFKKLMFGLQKDYKNKAPLAKTSIGDVVVAKYSDGAMYRGSVKIQKGDKYGKLVLFFFFRLQYHSQPS